MQRGASLPGLTGLRFFGAAWVLLYHAHRLRETSPAAIDLLGALGYTAVPLFFVLSGFVLTWIYGPAFDGGTASVGRFFVARLARVYPLYFLAFAWDLWNRAPQLPTARPALVVALGMHAWQPAWLPFANIPAWSVSNELFFYLVFPALIVLVSGGRTWLATRGGLWTLMGATYALSFVPWLAMRSMGAEDSTFLRFAPAFHAPELVIGMALGRLALLEASMGTPEDGSRLVVVAVVGLLSVAWFFHRFLPYPLVHDGLLVPLHGALVYGLARGGWAARPFAHPVAVRLGTISYGVYILQAPLEMTLEQHVWGFRGETGARLWLGYLLYWSVLLVAAALAWKLVEVPLRAAARALRPGVVRGIVVVAGLLVVVALGWTLLERQRNGWGPTIVVAADFQDELGCRTDWAPGCDATRLRRVAGAPGDELVYEGTFHVPTGTWAATIGVDEAFPFEGRGPDLRFSIDAPTDVAFLYSHQRRRLGVTTDVVTAPGSYQHLVGCDGDWLPDCASTRLFDLEGTGVLERSFELPAGHYEAKVALGGSWAENYGRDGQRDGENVTFDVTALLAHVRMRFDPRTKLLSVHVRE